MMRPKISSALLLLCTYTLCDGRTLVLDSDDFGPQALAYETIGFQWFQWNSQGPDKPQDKDSIKVVVYWDEPLKKVQQAYPVDPRKKQDFRYLAYDKALAYLDRSIREAPDAIHLKKTRAKLIEGRKNAESGAAANSHP